MIANLAREVEQSAENTTMFKFVASCKKISYEVLKSLSLVDVDAKTLTRAQQMPLFEQQVRVDFLRNIAKVVSSILF